jgi:D-alanyl-D-alanine dipeptidase
VGVFAGAVAISSGAATSGADGRAPDACGGCHGAALATWRASGHAAAWTSPLFRAGFQVEPRQFCVDCHAPVAARADDGIGCLSCHEAPRAAATPGHAVALRTRDELGDPALCRGCHEFATPVFEGGVARLTDLPMQRTWSEWLAYRGRGGAETCQTCHRAHGDHGSNGAHDVELLRRSLAVTVVPEAPGAVLTLASVGVGHSFPTGDLFRHLTVEVRGADESAHEGVHQAVDDPWRVVARLGRTFDTRLEGATLLARKVETADTSLAPGVPRAVALPASALSWRVVYHYGSERDERRGLVPAEGLFATLAAGEIAPPPPAAGAPAPPASPPPPSPPPEPPRADDPVHLHGFVDLADVAPGVRVDLRYAGADNFVGRPVRGYGAARCLVTRRAAAALSRVERALEARDHRLVVYDCYRPRRAVADFVAWSRTTPADAVAPEHNPNVPKGELFKRGYIASRSAHSRGSTVDVSVSPMIVEPAGRLRDDRTGRDCRDLREPLAPDGTLNMGTTFDCFDVRSHTDADVGEEARKNRALLRSAMEKEGFVAYPAEWWHFTLSNETFPSTDFDFEIGPHAPSDAAKR